MTNPREIERIEAIERDAWLDFYEAAPAPLRQSLGISQQRVDDGALLICRIIDNIQFNRLGYLGVSEPARGETLNAALDAFSAAGVKNWIVHVAGGAGGLAQLCAARGLMPHPRTWAKFIRDAQRAPTVETSLRIREVGPDRAGDFGTTAAAGFGMPPVIGEWLGCVVGRPRWRCLVAYDDGTPVAAGALYSADKCGWLGVGATLPTARKRGAQSALLAARINAAIDEGCDLLTTETGIPHEGEQGPSFANIQRVGFTIAYPRPNLKAP
jgi:GNAT superfamily N-acetyltransferase